MRVKCSTCKEEKDIEKIEITLECGHKTTKDIEDISDEVSSAVENFVAQVMFTKDEYWLGYWKGRLSGLCHLFGINYRKLILRKHRKWGEALKKS